MLYYTL